MTDEKTGLVTPSTRPRVYTFIIDEPVAVPRPREETSLGYARRWRSIRVLYIAMFMAGLSFSIFLSSCWPYLQKTDKESKESFLGWVIAGFSVGQLLSSPVLGFWANRRPLKEPMICSLIVAVAGNVLYAYAEAFENNARFVILSARILAGVGAGNVAVCRSYAGTATTLEERMSAMTVLNGLLALGVIAGPVFQAAFVPVGEEGVVWHAIKLHLDMYTLPIFLLVLLGICNLLLIVLMFEQHFLYVADDDEEEAGPKMGARESTVRQIVVPFDRVAVASCLMSVFIIFTILTLLETILTPLTMNEYGWTREKAVSYTGIVLGGVSGIGFIIFMSIPFLSKRMDDRYILIAGIMFIVLANFILLPWGDEYPPLQGVPSALLGMNLTVTGCPDQYDWCHTVPQLYVEQLVVGLCVISVGYPLCNSAIFTLYSKILGPYPQGTMMGWLTSISSLSRTLGPLVVVNIYTGQGPRVTFGFLMGLFLFELLCVLFAYKRLVPHRLLKF